MSAVKQIVVPTNTVLRERVDGRTALRAVAVATRADRARREGCH